MTYYLSLGSNLGKREQTLRDALQLIEQQVGPILRCSSFYYSAPWGFESENEFCNLCCAIQSDQMPSDVLHLTQAIERVLGRKEKSHYSLLTTQYSDRPIDIDIIRVFDNEGEELFIDTPELTIPHKLWTQRDFVKVPLAEIL